MSLDTPLTCQKPGFWAGAGVNLSDGWCSAREILTLIEKDPYTTGATVIPLGAVLWFVLDGGPAAKRVPVGEVVRRYPLVCHPSDFLVAGENDGLNETRENQD